MNIDERIDEVRTLIRNEAFNFYKINESKRNEYTERIDTLYFDIFNEMIDYSYIVKNVVEGNM